MERLAAGIERLEENDLLPIIKTILDNQTSDMYIKTNVDGTLHPKLSGAEINL
jgi:hypothetical protein